MFPRSPVSNAPKPGPAPAPECRAGWTRHLLKGLQAMPRDLAERTLGSIGAEHRSELESVNALRWLPFEVHMAVLGALRGALGPDAYRKFCFDQISASLSLPELFEKPAKLALRLYAGPLALFRALVEPAGGDSSEEPERSSRGCQVAVPPIHASGSATLLGAVALALAVIRVLRRRHHPEAAC